MKRMRSLVVASLLAPALALAQPKTADDWYKEGETQYNLGNFEQAAEAFKSGFAAETDDSKKPAYLYNVAQAYRQGNKCKDAAFFYKRYLSLKDQDTEKPLKPEKRAEIDQRITELEECAKNQESIANKPPNNTLSPNTGGTGTGTTTKPGTGTGTGTTVGQVGEGEGEGEEGEEEGEEEGDGVTTTWTPTQPRMLSARFIGGGSKISAGDLEMGFRGAFGLIGGYPIPVAPKLTVEAGVLFTYTPVPFENNMTGGKSTASLVNALVNAGVTFAVAPKIGVRGDIGVGLLSFGGIGDMGNPFTEGGAPTTGALTMFAFRVGVSADYAITPNLVATAQPIAFSYSPAKEGLREDVTSITQLEFMLGVGYRM